MTKFTYFERWRTKFQIQSWNA